MQLMIDILALRDLDLIGEILRAHVFVPDAHGNDLGCYSTFELRPEFIPVDRASALGVEMAKRLLGTSFHASPEEIENVHLYSDGRIHVGWYWDGDGVLLFMVDQIAFINTDCKKTYGWDLEMPEGVIDVSDIVFDRISSHQRLSAAKHPRFGFLNRILIALAPLVALEKFENLRHQVTEAIEELKKTLILKDSRAAQERIARRMVGTLARITGKYSKARDLPKLRAAHDALVACLGDDISRSAA